MVYLLLYLIIILDNINHTFDVVSRIALVLAAMLSVPLVIYYLVVNIECDDDSTQQLIHISRIKRGVYYIKQIALIGFGLLIFNTFMPSSKDAAIIFAGGYGFEVLTSNVSEELMSETSEAIKRLLKQVGVEDLTLNTVGADIVNPPKQ